MMMMPFVRLIAIYALVGAAIFAFLKRDDLMAYFATPEAEMAAPSAGAGAEANPTETLDATVEASATETPATEPTANARPTFGSQITPQYFGRGQTAAAAPVAPSEDSMVARWNKAREVFGQGNPAEAATLYEALAVDFPNNADLRGETGNLYYNLGQFNKAAIHYQAVGEIAGRDGNRQMAGSMLSLLQRIAPAKAAELQATLNAGQ
ncbi:MAG TPA: tetratricopeptide repeat protein [Rhodobacteraceae bacterium]|nr:tetratricopeptide repeat protein [Paracoccaceae bacterium]